MDENNTTLKYYADWAQPPGRTTKKGHRVHIHPHDLIAYVHKKEGIDGYSGDADPCTGHTDPS